MNSAISRQPRSILSKEEKDEDFVEWVPEPSDSIPADCPPGLEYLADVEQLLVHKEVELLGAREGINSRNRYSIKNSLGQQCFFALEDSDLLVRVCCGSIRGFTMHILDKTEQEVIRLTRPFKCCAGWCWCAGHDSCAHVIDVEAPPGGPLGQIRQAQSPCEPRFEIFSAEGAKTYAIVGPRCFCCVVSFEIFASNGSFYDEPIGRIVKQVGGFQKQYFTDSSNFSITFPQELDVRKKALLLGATFLIDMMYFEDTN